MSQLSTAQWCVIAVLSGVAAVGSAFLFFPGRRMRATMTVGPVVAVPALYVQAVARDQGLRESFILYFIVMVTFVLLMAMSRGYIRRNTERYHRGEPLEEYPLWKSALVVLVLSAVAIPLMVVLL
ncbi:hypothetical protein [Streptomyces sp. PR69]|uniref:hypothetical protein n=1 Tax=Streptomyces sp. PR69 TaxID=2984950 RepID=UPI0022649D83|nr:hypothetical protein [Streptomyces sp. PR69]